jgi:hypothetical protein
MATYLTNDYGFTVGAHSTVIVTVSWQNIPGVGPNHGPVIFTADPHSHLSDEVKLVTFDTAKCRNRPTGPSPQNPGTEVFYQFKVRNDSNIAAPFSLEMVFGEFGLTHSGQPW